MSEALLLVLNAGSSSLKFALFARDQGPALLRGQVEGLGAQPSLQIRGAAPEPLPPSTDLDAAFETVLQWIDREYADAKIIAAGHRIVHGGQRYARAVRLDENVLAELARLNRLAPLHQPYNLAGVEALARRRPELAQYGCFDTAFHATLPELARRYGLPEAFHRRGLRRYGFHGLSCQSAVNALRRLDALPARLLVAHLGNGASLCAIREGQSIDTTLGFSALDGLLMGSRCGSLDPGVLLYLMREDGLGADALERLLHRDCGLRGVSGLSHDMRVLLASDAPAARLAVDLFVYRVVREAGAMISVLGGIDALVFTGGIGEHAAPVRAAIAEGLAWTHLAIDEDANRAPAQRARRIDGSASRVACWVLPCDEEAEIASELRALLAAG